MYSNDKTLWCLLDSSSTCVAPAHGHAGDHGDPDLSMALDAAAEQGRAVAVCVFGHMHHRCQGDGALRRRVAVTPDGVLHLNAAVVPRHRVSSRCTVSSCRGRLHRKYNRFQLGVKLKVVYFRCCVCQKANNYYMHEVLQRTKEPGQVARHFVLLEMQQGQAVAAEDLWVADDEVGCRIVSMTPLFRTSDDGDCTNREQFDVRSGSWLQA